MKPNRSAFPRRSCGLFSGAAPLALAVCAAGCLRLAAPPQTAAGAFALDDDDARRAGALALYSKGLLLESAEGAETNDAKAAAGLAFLQASRLDPDNPRPVAALLSNLADRERYGEALAEAERYLARRPDDVELRLDAARLAEAADRPADAARHCARVLDAQPDNRELAQARVRLLFQSDQDACALEALREHHRRHHDRASAALPVQWAVHFTREEQRPARALACLDLALGQRTNAAERAALLTLAAESRLLLGQTNAAMDTLVHAYRENPAFTTPLLRLGALWAERPDATNTLARLARQGTDPSRQGTDPDTALLLLAATHQALDQPAAAVAALREAHARRMRAGFFPDEGFYLWLGSLLEEQQAFADAERLLLDALAAHPSSHETKNFLAYMWAERGARLDEANRLANEALEAEPDNAAYLDTKGWVLFKAGRVFDALQFLLRAAELDREEPVILDHVADALLAAGRESEAVAFWTRSYAFDPQPAVAAKLRALNAPPPQPANREPASP